MLSSGYVLHDRLLRAAMVGVAKGDAPAKAEPEPDGESEKLAAHRRLDKTV